MHCKKLFTGFILLFSSLFIYTKSICQNTPEQWKQIRAQREAQEAKNREMQKSQEEDRQRKYKEAAANKSYPADNQKEEKKRNVTVSKDATYNYTIKRRLHEGLAIATRKDNNGYTKYGFADESGDVVIPLIYDYAYNFKDGLAEVGISTHATLIDKEGEKFKSNFYSSVYNFQEGMARVLDANGFGFIDRTGKEIIPPQYGSVKNFSEGLACVQLNAHGANYGNGKWGFIDKTGKAIIPCQYTDVYDFSDGLAGIQSDGLWGFIDKTGKK
ncbi:MAG: WG repeat-containing protein [Ferruginibacter sp.]